MIEYRPITEPFMVFCAKAKIILGTWAKFVGAVFLISFFFGPIGPIGPLVYAAFLFTLALPVVLLTMWGRSLDSELKWDELDEGPL